MTTLTLSPRPIAAPAFRLRPDDDADGFVTYRNRNQRPAVYVRTEVIEQMIAHCHGEGPNEAIGFLAGRVFQDDDGPWVVVSRVVCCRHARSSRVTVATSARDELELDAWRQGEGLSYDRLGWWHSHYELRFAHYSGVDRDNQKLWCPRDWQVGLLVLVDEGEARVRCYRGPGSESLGPLRGEDGAAQPLPAERLRLPQHESLPEEAAQDAPRRPSPDAQPVTPRAIDWRRVAVAVAATLACAVLLGVGSGAIPTPAEFLPPIDADRPLTNHAGNPEASHARD